LSQPLQSAMRGLLSAQLCCRTSTASTLWLIHQPSRTLCVGTTDHTQSTLSARDAKSYKKYSSFIKSEPARKQLCVLTLGAKYQILLLNSTKSPEFTARKLARQFPISEQSCASLLSSLRQRELSQMLSDAKLVADHDLIVRRRWRSICQMLRSNRRFLIGYRWLQVLDKLPLMQNACGLHELPGYSAPGDDCLAELARLMNEWRLAQERRQLERQTADL
ncbi:hypothetical protein BOX15_Mlig011006g2, partial [Macrostomum lignano]